MWHLTRRNLPAALQLRKLYRLQQLYLLDELHEPIEFKLLKNPAGDLCQFSSECTGLQTMQHLDVILGSNIVPVIQHHSRWHVLPRILHCVQQQLHLWWLSWSRMVSWTDRANLRIKPGSFLALHRLNLSTYRCKPIRDTSNSYSHTKLRSKLDLDPVSLCVGCHRARRDSAHRCQVLGSQVKRRDRLTRRYLRWRP